MTLHAFDITYGPWGEDRLFSCEAPNLVSDLGQFLYEHSADLDANRSVKRHKPKPPSTYYGPDLKPVAR